MTGLLLAIQFLTIIPIRIRGTITEREVGGSGVFFPLVGVIQGLIASLAILLFVRLFPIEVVSGLTLLLLIATNRGFHLDALADTFDAIAVRSHGDPVTDRQKRLEVMKDSATGAMGVTAVVMSILLKYLFMGSLFRAYGVESTAYLIFLMPVFSKWAMIPAMAHGIPARDGGLGKMFVDGTGPGSVLLSSLIIAVIYLVATVSLGLVAFRPAVLFFLLAGVSLYAFGLFWALYCKHRFGGLTGDTSGAVSEIADLVFLAVVLLFF
jgi:adenosylcobinamide-GDP ribazoletransferase